MIQLTNISLQRGIKVLFEDANLTINPGQKVGLVGANGAGKSSLFKMILGELHPDQGEFQRPNHWRMAHMAQEVSNSDRSALDYVLDGDETFRAAEQAIQHAEENHLTDQLAHAHAAYEQADGYTAKSRAEQLLAGLGFKQQEMNEPVSSFSGGWRLRLNLAQALMCPSDLLLLDEPTNHLDLDAVFWLEQWLKAYPGTLILISHDRDFLDSLVTHIAHVDQQKLISYKGNYSSFEQARAEKLAQQQASFEKQQREIAHMESFIRRFKAKASKAKQAQSRVKALERMSVIAPAHVDTQFSFEFPKADKTSSPLLSIEDGEIGYNTTLLTTSCTLLPDMRIGLLGANGAGKSTFIKTLVGDLPLRAGKVTQGMHLYVGYFAQHQLEALDLSSTPLIHVQRISPTASEQSIRDFLGRFGFNGERATDVVKLFSGGEKARLALALIAWQKPNLLIMDEPTNHLDMESRFALTVALQEFEGAIIVVSHDRHLLKNTVDEFWLVHDQKIEPFQGDLDDYHNWLKTLKKSNTAAQNGESSPENTSVKPAVDKKAQRKREAEIRNALQPIKKKIAQLESRMEKVEASLSSINDQLNDTELYNESCKTKLTEVLQRQSELKQESEMLEMDWLELQEALEQQETELREL
ncbi:ATP-binding cassette domain-containing protein [Litoribrevibacter albus]|uniref:Probable ATP-binding protein YheS n=1 Tax=Litoribrevibacter albus TaxID=1473156 RepID=A0AA37SEL7_9GAMM|nr:ATP-binding cassette domain-containing protein [Litoribrevibacter albus]GLQ33081.1 ABC transporter ATP-binding protein [Litoribrevibacter albus]